MTIADLCIVNYCHRRCEPLKNIMRLPRDEAFALARKLAEQNRDVTAFYRFADFENYYPRRMETDALLHASFVELGGRPAQTHPLSFVLHGSDFLDSWFDRGLVTRVPLSQIPDHAISFTYGDSMTELQKRGELTMLTKPMLFDAISSHGRTVDAFLADVAARFHYMEAQLWDDGFLHHEKDAS